MAPRYIYVLVRTDIPLADQIVQVGHACVEAGHRFDQPADPCHLVVLSVPTAHHLRAALGHIGRAGIRCAVFHEPDDQLGDTAACTEPIPGAYRRVFRRFPLWSGDTLFSARGPPGR